MFKNIYARIFLAVVAAAAIFLTVNVLSSPQMALYQMLQAVKKNDVTAFQKYYAVPQPKATPSPTPTPAASPDAVPDDSASPATIPSAADLPGATATPGPEDAPAKVDYKAVMASFKAKYYRDLSFTDALFLKKQSEGVVKGTVNAGTLMFVGTGSNLVVYRIARTNGGWQIADVAKLDQ